MSKLLRTLRILGVGLVLSSLATLGTTDIHASPVPATENLAVWLKSDAGVILDANGYVTTWQDQSGQGHHATQTTDTYRPGLVYNSWAGRPVVHFDGSNDRLQLPTTSTLGIQNHDYEMYIVARVPGGGNDVQFLISGGTLENYEVHLKKTGTLGIRFIPVLNARVDYGSGGQFMNGAFHAFGARVDGGTGYVRVDGVQSTNTATNARSSADVNLYLGFRASQSTSPYFLGGDIAEVLIYNRALTTEERAQVETYLNRWLLWNVAHLTETGGGMLPTNIARYGTAFAKDCISGYPAHQIAHLNDGLYGNEHSWIAGSMDSFAGIAFDRPYDIDSIAFGRDNGGEQTQYTDRYLGQYVLQYTRATNPGVWTPEGEWITIGEFSYLSTDTTGYLRHLYTFDRINGVTGIRIRTIASITPICIDEIEVGAVPEPATFLLGSLALGFLGILACRRRVGAAPSSI